MVFDISDLEGHNDAGENLNVPLSMGGIVLKWYVDESNLIVKEARRPAYTEPQEHYVKVFGSTFCELLGIEAVRQNLCQIRYTPTSFVPGSYSKDFRQLFAKSISMQKFLGLSSITVTEYSNLSGYDKCQVILAVLGGKIGKGAAFRYLSGMCFVDYVLGNTDRHIQNYGGIGLRESRTSPIMRYTTMPLFDFGFGLLSNNRYITENTPTDLYSAYIAVGSTAIDFESMKEIFYEAWQEYIQQLNQLQLTSSFLTGIRLVGKRYFVNTLKDLGVNIQWNEPQPLVVEDTMTTTDLFTI